MKGRIVDGDFLQMDLSVLMGGRKFCVIGNYPEAMRSATDLSVRKCWPRAFLGLTFCMDR